MSPPLIVASIVGAFFFSLFVGLVAGRFFAFGSEQDANDRAESEAAVLHHNSEL